MQSASAPAPGDARFARRPLLDDPLDAVLPAGHPLAGRSAIALEALADDTWVGPQPGDVVPGGHARGLRRAPASLRACSIARTTSRPS